MKFSVVARESLAVMSPYDDETTKSLFRIGANYHRSVDRPDTTGLNWREVMFR
ncbi:hypothetical protein M9458_003871, partial [Cirrhinus mrigala]